MKHGFDFLRAFRLVWIIKDRKIDIVNVHGQNPLGKCCSILGRAKAIVHTDHGVTIGSPVQRKKRIILCNRLLSPFIDHYVAVSRGMFKSLKKREKVPEKKITLIFNGIDVEDISKPNHRNGCLIKELGLDPRKPIIGTVGRLSAEKQLPLLLKSIRILKTINQNFTCLIIGDGPEKSNLVNLSSSLHLDEQICFLGERADVPALLDLMDVFVFSSGGEGFSITILEAMSMSLPIVAFDVEGVSEAVVPEETGYLVPFGNIEEFADRISYLIDKPELAKKFGRLASRRVRSDFNLSKNIRKLESLYCKLLGSRTALGIRQYRSSSNWR
jgi:glycosyltransferase involved in cell wall biosynthesis